MFDWRQYSVGQSAWLLIQHPDPNQASCSGPCLLGGGSHVLELQQWRSSAIGPSSNVCIAQRLHILCRATKVSARSKNTRKLEIFELLPGCSSKEF